MIDVTIVTAPPIDRNSLGRPWFEQSFAIMGGLGVTPPPEPWAMWTRAREVTDRAGSGAKEARQQRLHDARRRHARLEITTDELETVIAEVMAQGAASDAGRSQLHLAADDCESLAIATLVAAGSDIFDQIRSVAADAATHAARVRTAFGAALTPMEASELGPDEAGAFSTFSHWAERFDRCHTAVDHLRGGGAVAGIVINPASLDRDDVPADYVNLASRCRDVAAAVDALHPRPDGRRPHLLSLDPAVIGPGCYDATEAASHLEAALRHVDQVAAGA